MITTPAAGPVELMIPSRTTALPSRARPAKRGRRLARWIAQPTISLSTHPTHHQGALEPRHVDLRVFVYYGEEPVVVPAALTRVAAAGSLVVNSSRGGGAKDTWLLR